MLSKIRKNSATTLLTLLLLMCNVSCSDRPDYVLDKKQMEDCMLEMHLLEASLKVGGYRYGSPREQQFYYAELLEKYHLSKPMYDSCLSWYTRHPRDFEKIYNKVLVRIDTITAKIERGEYHIVDSLHTIIQKELWTEKRYYSFTSDSARNQLFFNIEDTLLTTGDKYKLILKHRLGALDSSLHPHIVLYVNYLNGTIDSIYTKTYNDSILRRYTLIFEARKSLKIKSISGFLLGVDVEKGQMSATLDSIHLIRSYNPYQQDSIRTRVRQIDTSTYELKLNKQLPVLAPPIKKINPEALQLKEVI